MYAIFGLIVWRLGAMKAMVFAGLAASAIAMLAAELNSGWEDLLRGVAGFFSGCCVALAKTPLRARLHPAWVWGGLALIVVFATLAGLSGSVEAIIGFRAGWGLGNALFISTALATIVGAASGGSGAW